MEESQLMGLRILRVKQEKKGGGLRIQTEYYNVKYDSEEEILYSEGDEKLIRIDSREYERRKCSYIESLFKEFWYRGKERNTLSTGGHDATMRFFQE